VFATVREIAALSLLRTISPDAGEISPGIISACNQSYSAQYGKSAHGAQGEGPDRAFGEKPKSDASCMKRRSGESETSF
jgi:hypothetical protein